MTEQEIAKLLQGFYISLGGWMKYQYKGIKGEQGFTLTQFKTLFIINDASSCTMSYLSETMEVSKGTMTCMLNKLVMDGYVERKSCSKDRRNVYVNLTEKGEEKIKEVKEKILLSLVGVVKHLNEEEKQEMYRSLTSLNTILKTKNH
ncbi:MAG: MarR family transcriptional regulator [Clostridiaceae bacterium]|nr:MarR family transcriptional regulator [Clostridiaceae bacterium]